MILDNAPANNAILSNTGTANAFTIKATAKSFQILSSSLYSNKIRAIIRELSCNALDSHIGAGKIDIPFEVHLPTFLEPWFAVRDFGLGLDDDQIINVYTTYFESTKTDSNEFIGALGLGAKSPFSYTENFTVTAIKAGIKRIYSAFINEMGVPSIVEMCAVLTDESNGVEVKFSVTDRYDYNSFRNEAYKVFTWFEHKPIITGIDNFEHTSVPYIEKNIVPGVHTIEGHSCVAVMGNISYPLDNIPEAEKHFGELHHLLTCGLVLEFGIGDLDFAASREQLSYIPLTINNIRAKLEALNSNLVTHLAAQADAIIGEWERSFFLYDKQNTTLYKSAVVKYVTNTGFPLYDSTIYHGKKSFKYATADLEKRGLNIDSFSHRRGGICNKNNRVTMHINGVYTKALEIPVANDVIIVLNDLKTGCHARAQYHYGKCSDDKYVNVFCVSHSSADLAIRQIEYDKFIAELHNPPIIIKASELMKRERKIPASSQGIATLGLKTGKYHGYTTSYTWMPYTTPIDEDETYYYVCLNNHESIKVDGTPFDMMRIKALMDTCGVSDISKINIFGVRKSRTKEIKQLDNWVWIEDILKEEIAKVSDEHIASLVAAEMLDTYYNRVYTSKEVAKYVGPTSDYARYVTEMSGIERATGNVIQLVELCNIYGKSIQVETVKKRIQDTKDALYKKYPLLKYFKEDTNDRKERDLAEYIKLVDKQ